MWRYGFQDLDNIINSLRPGDAYMRQWIGSSLDQIMSAISEGLQSASDFAHCPMSHRSLLHTLDIQFPNELSREGSMVRQSTVVLLYKKRTCAREPAPTTTIVFQNPKLDSPRQLILLTFLRWSMFNLAYCDGRVRVWKARTVRLTLYVLILQREHKHIFTFYIITPHWYDTGT